MRSFNAIGVDDDRVVRRPFKLGFTKLPRVFVDSGIVGAIGALPFLVYMTIRRFERTKKSPLAPRIATLLKKGHLVSYLNQTTIAELLGLSRSSVNRSVRLLRGVKWVEEVRLKDNGRAYKLGFRAAPDASGKEESVYFADHWLRRSLERLPDAATGWKHASVRQRRPLLVQALQRIADDEDDILNPKRPRGASIRDR